MYDSDTKDGHQKQLVVVGAAAAVAAIASHVPLSFFVWEHNEWKTHLAQLVEEGMYERTYQMTLNSFE